MLLCTHLRTDVAPTSGACRAAVLAVYAAEALLLAFALKLKVAAAGRGAGGGRSVRTGLGTAGCGSARTSDRHLYHLKLLPPVLWSKACC
jgi:hypothetical protein